MVINVLSAHGFNDLLEAKIQIPSNNRDTRSYIINIFAHPVNLTGRSVTLLYSEAKAEYNFQKFQTLGDWLLFAKSMYPQSLGDATPEYYDAIAQNAYYKCYKIINKQWPLYEELADMFPVFVERIQNNLTIF